MTEKLDRLTRDYLAAVEDLIANRKFGEGIFGMPDSARDSPVHTEYYAAVESAVRELAGEVPDAQTAEALVRFLLTASSSYPGNTLSEWMLVAIQTHALPLIAYLTPEVRAELSAWYNKAFPRLQRLPNQVKIGKALKK